MLVLEFRQDAAEQHDRSGRRHLSPAKSAIWRMVVSASFQVPVDGSSRLTP
jgi:hypothetical protein